MKTVKSLSAVLALTVGMSAVAGVSALNYDWFGSSSSATPNTYFSFSYGQTDLDAKIAQLQKAWENKEAQQKDVKELTKLRCDLLKAIAGTQFVYENQAKLKTVVLVKATAIDASANVSKIGKHETVVDNQLKIKLAADVVVSAKDADDIKAALKAFNDENVKVIDAASADAKVNALTFEVVAGTVHTKRLGNKTQGQLVVEKAAAVQALIDKVTSESYKKDVELITLAQANGNTQDFLFKELTRLNNELNKLDEFVSVLTNLDVAIFDESCEIKFAGKLPIKDSTKAGEAKADAKADAKDNVPNTAAAAATASVAFASIFAAAAAVVAKRK